MRSVFWLLAGTVFALPAVLTAQSFEGVVKQHYITIEPERMASLVGKETDPAKILAIVRARLATADSSLAESFDATIHIKGERLRTDVVQEPGGFSIVDAAEDRTYTVNAFMRLIVIATPEDAAAMARAYRMPPDSAPSPTTTDLGTRTIAGMQAHGYRLANASGAVVKWVAPDVKWVLAPMISIRERRTVIRDLTRLQAAVHALGEAVSNESVERASPALGGGWVYGSMAVTSVHAEPVDDALFALPTDYQRLMQSDLMPAAN